MQYEAKSQKSRSKGRTLNLACMIDHKGWGQIPGSTEEGGVLQQFWVSCIFTTIFQSNQQFGAADWKTRRKTCLDGYFILSNPQKLHSSFWGYFRLFHCLVQQERQSDIWSSFQNNLDYNTAINTCIFKCWTMTSPRNTNASQSSSEQWRTESIASGERLWSRISLALLPTALHLSSPRQDRVRNKIFRLKSEFKMD